MTQHSYTAATDGFGPTGTFKTDETYSISNHDFLKAIFDEVSGTPLVVQFAGDPRAVAPGAWAGKPYNVAAEEPDAARTSMNAYFSLAALQPDAQGVLGRKKVNFASLTAIMLDDVGTKVPMDVVLRLKPTWMIETSPGNFQAGYQFDTPLTDVTQVEALMSAIIAARFCDPGAGGPATRLARLPVGVNGKQTPAFDCRVVRWSPNLRYTPEQIATAFDLELAEVKQPRLGGHAIWTPKPQDNPIVKALKVADLYKAPLSDHKHDITCPWVTRHTGNVDHGTAYFEPSAEYSRGGFKCFHSSCAGYSLKDLLNFLRLDADQARTQAIVRLLPGSLALTVNAAERALAATGGHYQRAGSIVTITHDQGTREAVITPRGPGALACDLASAAIWQRMDGRSRGYVDCDPPPRHVAALIDEVQYKHLPVLSGLARQPYFRPDGTICMQPGYDQATGMFGAFEDGEFDVPTKPTRAEAEAALADLKGLLVEFPFAGEMDEAAALSALLTATIRPTLIQAPMFHVRAHSAGSGKSHLCAVFSLFATPKKSSPMSFPSDDEECRKLLLAECLRGPAVIEFDNLTSDLIPHKSLCTALTSEQLSGRILGVSKTASVSTRVLFLSSGNNVGPVRDMARRTVTISLDPSVEMPATRTFSRPDLLLEVQAMRGQLVSAALTVIRAWIATGRPMTECKPLVGFNDWSDFCRQPLLWLGCKDPVASVFEALAEDPDRETLGSLQAAWRNAFGSKPTMVREAVAKSDFDGELREALLDVAEDRGAINRGKLGWWLKHHEGRIVDGMRFVRVSGARSAALWAVEIVAPASEPVTKWTGRV